jgi:hypothetical protein
MQFVDLGPRGFVSAAMYFIDRVADFKMTLVVDALSGLSGSEGGGLVHDDISISNHYKKKRERTSTVTAI